MRKNGCDEDPQWDEYDDWERDFWDDKCHETKGGKPSPGTQKDGRLKENQPGAKKPFPGAGKPFGGKTGKKS